MDIISYNDDNSCFRCLSIKKFFKAEAHKISIKKFFKAEAHKIVSTVEYVTKEA